jgi:hypothetical protein
MAAVKKFERMCSWPLPTLKKSRKCLISVIEREELGEAIATTHRKHRATQMLAYILFRSLLQIFKESELEEAIQDEDACCVYYFRSHTSVFTAASWIYFGASLYYTPQTHI